MPSLKSALSILESSAHSTRPVPRNTDTMLRLMDILSHPHRAFKSVHVTGTNGKGSVTGKIGKAIESAGYKVGVYTSPHLFSWRQRIQINSQMIEEQFFVENVLKLNSIAKSNQFQLTFFEYLTAMSFLYFKEKKVDLAVIQVGLGGMHDTTNVISSNLSVITSIGIDHQKLLGNTKELIARDKAGIIKEGKPVVLGPNAKFKDIQQMAKIKNSPIYYVDNEGCKDFQDQNNKVVRKCIDLLQGDFPISSQAIEKGLNFKQPCRMQHLSNDLLPKWCKNKRVIFDVGHNPAAIQKMIEYFVKNQGKQAKLAVLYGASKDKNVQDSLKEIQKIATCIYFVQANNPRAMPINEFCSLIYKFKHPSKFRVAQQGDIKGSLVHALADQSITHVLVCGSFFIMPQAMGFFDPKYEEESKIWGLQQGYPLVQK